MRWRRSRQSTKVIEMRLIAEYDRTSYDADGTAILSLKVPRYQHKQLLAELDQSVQLAVEIKVSAVQSKTAICGRS